MKTQVAVVALHCLDGKVLPLWIEWDNQIKYEVDKIYEIRRAASLKHGGVGLRYKCKIQNSIRYLYYENPTWFVEK